MIIRPSGVVVQNQRLLLMQYNYGGHPRFNLPGGNLEPNEQIVTTLIREFSEELGVNVTPGDLLFSAETSAGGRYVLHLIFRILSMTGDVQLNPQQTKAKKLDWLSKEEVAKAPLYPAISTPLSQWMAGDYPSQTHLGHLNQPWFS